VVGFHRELYAPPSAVAADGTTYHFTGWSDGQGMRHTVTTPEHGATWTATYAPSAPFTATYYAGTTLSGPPLLTRADPAIDFTWDFGSPAPEVPADSFSARWTKKQYFAGGRYRFTAVTDDGFRLYLDGALAMQQWPAQPGTAYDWIGDLGPGNHTLTFEYKEDGGAALAKLDWVGTVDQPGDTWRADYWNVPGTGAAPAVPSAAPDLSRDEPAIDHDWARAAPAPGVDDNHFVARWTRTLSLAPGEYEFTTTADDGVRLTVDGVRVIDRWGDSSGVTDTARTILDGGPHTVVMDYYDNWGEAVAKLAYRQTADRLDPQDYTAEFWNLPVPGSSPLFPQRAPDLVRTDAVIASDWGDGSPVTSDSFAARWTRTDTLAAGLYRFEGAADDGIRVYVDGAPVVDRWIDQNATFSADRMLLSGTHEIRVEYYEHGGGALARFDYRRVGDYQPANLWTGVYSAGGVPLVTRQDDTVDFDWGNGSPDLLVPADGFTARWTRTADYAAGTYRFTATGDDGIRVLLDGVTVVDGSSE